MDDTQVKANNQQTQQPAQGQRNAQGFLAQPIGTMQKEHVVTLPQTNEFVKPSEAEPVLTPEVEKAGVEKVAEFPQVREEQYKVGIRPAKESVPVSTEPLGEVKLPPIPEQEVLREIKATKNDDSRHWLMVLFEKIYQQIRAMHKKITGS